MQLGSIDNGTTPDLQFTYDGASYRNGIFNAFNSGSVAANKMKFFVSDSSPTGKTTVMTLQGDGNVGIGTTNAKQKLDINGGIGFANQNSTDKTLYSPVDGVLEWMTHNAAGEHGFAVSHQGTRAVYLNTSGNSYINGGNVAIGATDPQGYKLAVNGSAIAESMTVKLHGNWPDYVFKKEYALPSLIDVKTYIDKNQHLPDMPSEAEVTKNGINLGEIVKAQTKKIEELTLYLIEQQKQIEDLKTLVTNNAKK